MFVYQNFSNILCKFIDFEGSAVTYWDGNEANDFKLPLEKKNNHCKHNEMLIWYSTVKGLHILIRRHSISKE